MTATEKAAAGAETPTTAAGLDTTPKPISIITENQGNFTMATAQNIYNVMCSLLGQQEGIEIKVSVRQKEAGGKTIA